MHTILVVDDRDRIRKTYIKVFTKEGYHVLEARNADEANDIVKSAKVDLMLLDINMPEVDGTVLYEVVRLFKKNLKVIVSSVFPLDDQKYLVQGAVDYFDKSEGIQILKKKVKRVLPSEVQKELFH